MHTDQAEERDQPLSEAERGRRERIAAVHHELEELEAASKASAAGLEMGSSRASGASIVYSIRLDRGEVEAIERRAAAHGLKPTVFARNLIRMGIAPRGAGDLAIAIERAACARRIHADASRFRLNGTVAPQHA